MEKHIVVLLQTTGKMSITDISHAIRLDKFDTFAILTRLMEKGRVTSHQNLFTGAERFSAV